MKLHEPEELYRSIVENAQDVIFTLAIDGTITFLNPAFEMITGWSGDEWLDKQIVSMLHPADRPVALEFFHHILEGKTPPAFEVRILSKSGDYMVWEIKATPQIKKGLVVGILGIARDITERKHAEEALRKSESKYRLLLENLPQRIFYKDKNLTYVSCNENFARDLHMKPDEIIGKTDFDLFPVELAEKYREDDKRIMESGKLEDREDKYIKDGQEMIIHIVKAPVKDEKGDIVGLLGIFGDITEKIILERKAERSRHLASLGELAASVGHEINNPITGIINYAQILFNNSKEGSEEKDLATRIIKEGNRIASITSKLLSFAKLSELREKKSIVNIQEIMSDTLILTEMQLRQESIKIKLDIPSELPGILAHPQLIQQAFLNIINNARYALNQKYPETHDNKIFEILGEEITMDNLPYVKITFYDHGTGIPANMRDKIMEPFFTTKPGRTGLGLSISRDIIKDHGGRLMVESVEGEFTKVTILLPVFRQT